MGNLGDTTKMDQKQVSLEYLFMKDPLRKSIQSRLTIMNVEK